MQAMRYDEDAFHSWLARSGTPHPRVRVPIGDDGAVLSAPPGELVVAADLVAEGTHFTSGTDPRLVGRKALARNLSDLAAMAADPWCAVATLALPRGAPTGLARGITEGIRELGAAFDCPLVGGDTGTHGGGVVVSVTVIGTPHGERPVLRSGGREGDVLVLTGAVGGSGRGRHLRFTPRLLEMRRLVAFGPPTAMIDISDGLLLDLARLADASGVGFELEGDRVPLHADAGPGADPEAAFSEGEDFELVAALAPEAWARVEAAWDGPVPLTRIGTLVHEGRWLRLRGERRPARARGFRHA
jgi:thiamine-monophosphate kinase